ncbi:MAG: hypothetical protein JXX29_16045 [Deltaproteobacteria bacterium]|nr:hypothetical protein [Deltaproteobacteria bacterium]MBN2673194.1 hypothetical protein [Deltaproteobacteria bacterium]
MTTQTGPALQRLMSLSLMGVFLSILLCAYPRIVSAGGEKIWELAGHDELARGELVQTLLSSRGEITKGFHQEKIDLDAVGMVWCAATDKNGTIYLGTGYDGKIYRIEGNKARLIATTDNLVVTDMLFSTDGALYLATIPSPTIWKLEQPDRIDPDAPVSAQVFAQLEPDTLIWTIAQNETTGIIYAGTGHEGKIWAIEKDGTPNLYLDTEEKHILDLLPVSEDTLYAGTSPNALLLKVTAPGSAFAVADFEGSEVKSIVPYKNGSLAVGVNEFTYPRKAPVKQPTTATSAVIVTSTAATSSLTKTSSKDKGAVYVVQPDGAFESYMEESGTHVVMLAIDTQNTLWAAMGDDGRIVSISDERIIREVANLEEREVMWIDAVETLSFAATADAGAAYRFSSSVAEHAYLSPVLDADNVAALGRVTWSSSGELTLRARSGNTITPDISWSPWSRPIAKETVVDVPAARYVQLKFFWNDQDAVLYSVELTYKPRNQRAVITQFNPDTPFTDTKGASRGEAGTSERTITARPGDENLKQLKLSWSVSNPDGDKIRYRLYYKPIDKKLWIPIFREDYRHSATHYTWPTDAVPEGRYHFKLTADDSIENPDSDTLSDEELSVPVNIDNHPPQIELLQFQNGRISGKIVDSFSSIGAIDYAVDGGLWLPVAAKDGMLDSRQESFQFAPEPALAPGGHVVAVRATDRSGNFSVKEIHLEIAK